jgi:hypothetical protein
MGNPKTYADQLVGKGSGIGSLSRVYKSLPDQGKFLLAHTLRKRIGNRVKTYTSVMPVQQSSTNVTYVQPSSSYMVKCNGKCYYTDFQTFASCNGNTSCICNSYYLYGPYTCPY